MASMRPMAQQKVTRGTVALARGIDSRDITWKAAAELADLDPAHLGEVVKGKEPGRDTIAKLNRSKLVEDANLWLEAPSSKELEEWARLMHSMRERAMDARGLRGDKDSLPSPEAP